MDKIEDDMEFINQIGGDIEGFNRLVNAARMCGYVFVRSGEVLGSAKPEPIEEVVKLAIEALNLNHDYHQKHDEYNDYGDCELCEKNMKALAELKAYQTLSEGGE